MRHRLEWVDLWSVFLLEARASKTLCRIVLLRMVTVAEVEGASADADGIVVCFLSPQFAIRNRDESGVTHLTEEMFGERWTPHTVLTY
jgi:hypothetical protein